MIECREVLELIPWYVTGKLDAGDAAAVAVHIQACESCRFELAEATWIRHAVGARTFKATNVRQRVWRRVATKAGFRDAANIDIGSLIVGFRLGVNARRTGSPVRANLRVMGRNVRVVGAQRRETRESEGNAP